MTTMDLMWLFDTERRSEKRMGRELEEFRQKKFSAMERHLRETFPNSYQTIKLRPVSLAAKVADDGAAQYKHLPIREFLGITEVQKGALEDLFVTLDVNGTLSLAERKGVLQQGYMLGIWPDSSGREGLYPFMPYDLECEPEWDDPWAQARGDLRAATRVKLLRPVTLRGPGGWRTGVMRITLERDLAYYYMPGEESPRGLLRPDGANPLGRVPLVGTRREVPEGRYMPGPAEDVYGCTVGMVMVLSDAEHLDRESTIKPMYSTGGEGAGQTPSMIPLRPGYITHIPGENVQVTAVDISVDTKNYIGGAAILTKFMTQFRGLRPQGYEASIVTGPAANVDREGFYEGRRDQEVRCEVLEADLTELAVDVRNAIGRRALQLAQPKVRTRYRYARPRENVLQEAQASSILVERGLWSDVEQVAEAEGISFDDAVDLIEKRLTKWKSRLERAAGGTPGLDKIKAPGEPGRPSVADLPPPEVGA